MFMIVWCGLFGYLLCSCDCYRIVDVLFLIDFSIDWFLALHELSCSFFEIVEHVNDEATDYDYAYANSTA
jgi:hypothetical protein